MRAARLAGIAAAVLLALTGLGVAVAASPPDTLPAYAAKPCKGRSCPTPTPTPTSASPTPTPTSSVTPTPTATPSATGACTGVAGAEGGADPYGTCWPGPATTGVPAGTTLTVLTGNQTFSTAGQVVDGKDIRGCVNVTAPRVVIKNSKVTCTAGWIIDYYVNTVLPATDWLTVQDVTVSCGNTAGNGIGERNFRAVRVNISGCENGFDADQDAAVEDSYIHDLYQSAAAHTDGIQSAFGHRLTLTHSTWYANNGTAAININNQPTGPQSTDTLISRNLLAGGAYAMYCPTNATVNYRVTDNRWSRKFYPTGGAYGPWTDCDGEITSGNVWADTGQPI